MGCSGVVSNVRRSILYVIPFKIFHRGIFYDKRVDIIKYQDCEGEGKLIQSDHISGGLSSYRRRVFDRIEYDLKNDFFYCEDIEFSIRAADFFGHENFVIATNVCLQHHVSSLNRDTMKPRWARKTHEFILLYKKNKEKNFVLLSLIWLIIGLTFEALVSALRFRNIEQVIG